MTFVIRTVSRTADGREIVRPVTLAGPVVTIGRDASNDIYLPDLAVEPFHATLTQVPGGDVQVTSIGTLGFTIDGRTKQAALIGRKSGGELRFGGHRLTIGFDGETVIVRVERTDAVSDATSDKDERTAFSLAGLLPGKRTSAWTLTLVVLAAFLIAPIWTWASYRDAKVRPVGFHADMAWSSGPLSKAHHGLEGDCQACHDKAFVSVEDRKCVACHTGIHDHADPRRQVAATAPPDVARRIGNAFKVAFGKPTGQRCVDCHSEHEGAGPMQPTASVFCADCHGAMKSRLTDTRLENASDFGTAHPQFRPAVYRDGRIQRITLDAHPREDNGLKFPHDVHLSATGGVARMAQTLAAQQGWGAKLVCKDCHTPTADGVRFVPIEMESKCAMCHSLGYDRVDGTVRTLKHGNVAQAVADVRALGGRPVEPFGLPPGRLRPGVAVPASHGSRPLSVDALFVKGGACYDCHVIDRTGDAATGGWHIRKVEQPMRYLAKGWFDHNAHRTESCASCHAAETSHSAADVLIPGIGRVGDKDGATCRGCHGGERSSAKVPSSCAMCHDYHMDGQAPWRPAGQVVDRRSQTIAFTETVRP